MLGAGIVGVNAGELIAETVHALEMGADAEDLALTVHPHPTLSETVGFAAEIAEGTITDLYVPKRKRARMTPILQPSASYSITMRVRRRCRSPGPSRASRARSATRARSSARSTSCAWRRGGSCATSPCRASTPPTAARWSRRSARSTACDVDSVSDRTFLMHKGGKIAIRGRVSVETRDDLSMVYTPGVARVCMAIKEDPEKAWPLTIKGNAIAVVTDGTAVLGLGDIGPRGRHAGDGGQVAAVPRPRRRRRLPAVPGHP